MLKNIQILLPFFVFTIFFSACKSIGGFITEDGDCFALTAIDGDGFDNLRSDIYILEEVKQVDGKINMRISSNFVPKKAILFWNGAVKKTYIPQTSVKLVASGKKSAEPVITELCFDADKLSVHGEKIKVYFMDDEEVLEMAF